MTVGAGNLQPVKHACTAQRNIVETTVSVLKNIKEWRARKQSRRKKALSGGIAYLKIIIFCLIVPGRFYRGINQCE